MVRYQWLVLSFRRVFECAVGQCIAYFHLLREENLYHDSQGEPFILCSMHAGIDRELLAVHDTAESLPFVFGECRMCLQLNLVTHLISMTPTFAICG